MQPLDHRSPSRLVAVVAAVVLTAFCGAATADVSPEEMEQFETHLERGGSHLNDENYEEAVEHLRQAREIMDHPQISLNIADALLELDRCAEAQREFGDLRDRDDLDEGMQAELQEGLEALEDCVETTLLEVDCDPAGARLHLQGPDIDTEVDCPYADQTPVGEIDIRATAEHYVEEVRTVTLEPGQPRAVAISLQHDPPEEQKEEDEPEVAEEPDDEPEVAEEPDDELDEDPEVAEPAVDEPVDDPTWPTVVGLGALGIGAGLLAGGGVVDYRAGSRADELAEARAAGDFEEFERLEDQASSDRTTAAVLYGTGSALILGGLTLQLLDFSDSETERALQLETDLSSVSATFRW